MSHQIKFLLNRSVITVEEGDLICVTRVDRDYYPIFKGEILTVKNNRLLNSQGDIITRIPIDIGFSTWVGVIHHSREITEGDIV